VGTVLGDIADKGNKISKNLAKDMGLAAERDQAQLVRRLPRQQAADADKFGGFCSS
jgi:hypothetical protein